MEAKRELIPLDCEVQYAVFQENHEYEFIQETEWFNSMEELLNYICSTERFHVAFPTIFCRVAEYQVKTQQKV